uniref:SGS domain-containing protein n=1 Tax=Brassica oleracea var. oleracea TaxID=109376 RepID=A0A0D3EBF5_BRAOL
MRLTYPSSKRVKDWDKLEAEVESNGTLFSTDEKEVGTKKIESTPPDRMELKKWEI